MGQKGFGLVIFLIALFLTSAGIVGGLVAVKKYKPDLVAGPTFSPTPVVQKPKAQPTQKEDSAFLDPVEKLRSAFSCHFSKYGQYPKEISSEGIDKECVAKYINANNANIMPGKYVTYNNGQSYSLEANVFKKILITDKGWSEYKITPEEETISKQPEQRYRDAARLTDLANLQQAINVAIQDAGSSANNILCSGLSAPCFGSSYTGTRVSNGTGWVKINIASQRSVSVPTLPVDPINDEKFHYVYCATATDWEINATLDSDQQSVKMKSDEGDDDFKYEVGSNLTLIDKVPGCKY